jgi:hypothetical protein
MLVPLAGPSRGDALAFVRTRGRPCLQRDLSGVARPFGGLLTPRPQVQLVHGYLLSPALGIEPQALVLEKGRLKLVRYYLRDFHSQNAERLLSLRPCIEFELARLQVSITLLFRLAIRLRNDEGDPWVALA